MVLISAARDYVIRMLNEVQGIKALLVDQDTLSIVSLVLSQSDILHKEVFLVENVDAASSEVLNHLRAICFLRPTAENVEHLKRHLSKPRFNDYNLFFTNILSNTFLHTLADADENEVVKQVHEFYADFLAVDAFHFSLAVAQNHFCYVPLALDTYHVQRLGERCVEGLASLFLALKKRPVIRYQKSSETARRIAHEAGRLMYEKEKPLFDFRRTESAPLLLVIDRRDDPVTPLLNQWTYQAMVHELIGVNNNRVDLRHAPNQAADQKEFVLSAEQDEIFKANMYENFGDVGSNVANLVGELQKKDRRNRKLQTLEDMAQLLETFPEYRREAGAVAKHVAIMSELQRAVDTRQLMAVSQTEQELACSQGQAAAFEAVMSQLGNERVGEEDRLRLVMLYALRYEKESPRQLEQLMARLAAKPSKLKPALVYTLLRHCGSAKRTGDLFGNKDLFNMVARNVKRGLKGVENIYTQHQPLLEQTLDSAVKGRLKDLDYPFVGNHFQQGRPQDVVIFIAGGTTYEEARTVALYNAANPGSRVILGGTSVLNSSRFFSDLAELYRFEERSGFEAGPLDHL